MIKLTSKGIICSLNIFFGFCTTNKKKDLKGESLRVLEFLDLYIYMGEQ